MSRLALGLGLLAVIGGVSGARLLRRARTQNPNLFKEAVPISDAGTLARIHLNFRLTYLKDVVMAR